MCDESKGRRQKALVIYLMSGPETPELAEAAVAAGADLIELGFPFSDPLADGPVIRRAAERALAHGMRTRACLECLAATRERLPETPLVPMTYSSLLEAYGWERFAADAHAAGATSLIVVDLPAGERPELRRVQLVAPTSTDERIALAAAHTDGWLYLATVARTTGARRGRAAANGRRASRAPPTRARPPWNGAKGASPRGARRSRRDSPRTAPTAGSWTCGSSGKMRSTFTGPRRISIQHCSSLSRSHCCASGSSGASSSRSEEHTSELQSPCNLVCRLLLEKKKNNHESKK